MIQVKIINRESGKTGSVLYDGKNIDVVFPSKKEKSAIEEYLNTKRDFRIPDSDAMDDFRIDRAFPKDSETYFRLALCSLWAETGIWVEW